MQSNKSECRISVFIIKYCSKAIGFEAPLRQGSPTLVPPGGRQVIQMSQVGWMEESIWNIAVTNGTWHLAMVSGWSWGGGWPGATWSWQTGHQKEQLLFGSGGLRPSGNQGPMLSDYLIFKEKLEFQILMYHLLIFMLTINFKNAIWTNLKNHPWTTSGQQATSLQI